MKNIRLKEIIFSIIIFLLTLFIVEEAYAQKDKEFPFFPADVKYDPDFPTPESILGYSVGEWHVSHDQLVYYMKEMARLSDRITIK